MGYWVSIELNTVHVPAEKVTECLAAINAMHEAKTLKMNAGGGSSTGDSWYSWVDNPPEGGFKTLVEAFGAWRYEARIDEKCGCVIVQDFTGSKWGDDEQLYAVIAPFVKEGLIECRGEDGALWRYALADGELAEEHGQIVWG